VNTVHKLICIFLLSFGATSKVKSFFNPNRVFVKNINLEQGVSQCVVTDLAVDQKGFLWLGTFDGLNRFDGTEINVFKHIPNDERSLPSSKIFKLLADKQYHLWIKTSNGVCLFDTRTGKKVPLEFLGNQTISWVCENDDESVWAYIKSKGLTLINTKILSNKFTAKQNSNLPTLCDILDMYKIENRIYILGECGDMIVYDISSSKYSFIKNTITSGTVYDNAGLDKYNNIYFGSQQVDMIYFDIKLNTFQPSKFYSKNSKLISVKSIHFDSTNNILLLGTYGQGLFVFDYETELLSQYKKNGESINLSSNYIQRTIVDKKGIIYIGYDGMGIDVLDPFIKKFTSIVKRDADDLKSLRFVRKIIEDDHNNLLIGTSGSGLVKYNRDKHTFAFYNSNNALENSGNFIIEMIRVDNQLWLGYNGEGVDILDINSLKKIGSFKIGTLKNQISDGTIWSFLNDGNGNIWIGTRTNGLNKVNIQTREVEQFNTAKYPLLSSGMRCMVLLSNKHILIGSEEGLFELNPRNNQLKMVFPKSKKDQAIKSFKTIYIDQKNRIWLGTDGMGIAVLSQDYQLLKNFNSTNSLKNDVVYGILPDGDSTFWISSNAGLSSFQWNEQSLTADGKIQTFNYDEKNGLQSNEFNTGAYQILKDGNMAFGGLNGINVFNPKEIKNNEIVPIVYINEFKVFENVLNQDTLISYMSSVNLSHFENSFSITFSTIGFSLPGKTKFRYRLVGNDNEWINADSRNYVSYTNLRSGDYTFQVKACNYDGVWNENYTSLPIHIATPFYKAWWFILLLLALGTQIAYLFYRYRLKLANEKEELKIIHTKEIAEVEMKALRAQINPHFLFNSLNSINSYILKNDNKLASKYLVKFSQLVRSILNNSSSPYISLKEELNTIELYMHIEGMRFNNQFTYLIDVEPNINTANILIPSLLLQPYVENAIWHGLLHKEGEKSIAIRVIKQSMESVCILIDDNGVGRIKAAEIENKPKHRKSFGMELGENRLKLMNAGTIGLASVMVIDKVDRNNNPTGTTIKIIIPSNIFIEEKISLN